MRRVGWKDFATTSQFMGHVEATESPLTWLNEGTEILTKTSRIPRETKFSSEWQNYVSLKPSFLYSILNVKTFTSFKSFAMELLKLFCITATYIVKTRKYFWAIQIFKLETYSRICTSMLKIYSEIKELEIKQLFFLTEYSRNYYRMKEYGLQNFLYSLSLILLGVLY